MSALNGPLDTNSHEIGESAQVTTPADSHAAATKPRPKRALPATSADSQKSLDVCAEVPLHLRLVLTYAEVAALGIAPERTLRRLVAIGRVKRSVIRNGRSVRFVVRDLLDELREGEG